MLLLIKQPAPGLPAATFFEETARTADFAACRVKMV